ncbi:MULTISPECIES: C4-dicarboxylate transporter DcuC [Pelosinus]|uniref:C4-dicarboxylate anaerobic carrier-like protein n=1 Tax=Pelosinus fermentans B4 TaxID=1149862 RepID=I9ARK6_9FIRM|nr:MULTISPECIES: C4-dicarboxylate transporter DcuC [Pelosinus]EIW15582.1 C4-dicarboxylate anaerobic carrier-like protein [Pelosinus fermentans B4]EIW26728.1 anaerobic c4-dicarboxylate antiporter, DcuC family [Pelosinus fermentans A11]OAM92327.1 C4-dicarboxylate anaerobic carrier-like protein [Pelosinus fermentans DSM 17108]SDQ40994.1 C4-dicarboxylate transporter, DcuC family [Pelosinus fermentans]
MIWIGILIVALTFLAIIRRYETRLVLFVAGVAMALVVGKPLVAIDAFAKTMVSGGLVTTICTVMGFSYVMKLTGCDSHLVNLLTSLLKQAKFILIPGAVIVTWIINIALPSTAGCAAAVGAVLIPTLIVSGVHPAMAAACVMSGTIGSVMSPGLAHNPFVAKLANVDVMTVIAGHTIPALISLAVAATMLTIVCHLRKEGASAERSTEIASGGEKFKVNVVKAVVPVIPLVLLVLGSKMVALIPEVTVPQAMIIGAMLGFVVTWGNAQEISKSFFKGMGDSYGEIVGIIIAAAVFTQGMDTIGLTGALIENMKESQDVARYAASIGPFFLAVLSGSGDAAALAFNGAVTPHAAQFGFKITDMGSLATISGGLGRTMSPVAGGAIVCATIAGVNPMEIAKRTAPGMFCALVAVLIVFSFN